MAILGRRSLEQAAGHQLQMSIVTKRSESMTTGSGIREIGNPDSAGIGRIHLDALRPAAGIGPGDFGVWPLPEHH
jgi:hypothetical protein